jgi:hypothetical protein
VYGEGKGSSAVKPPIDVFAAAIQTNQGKIYIALTVKAALGKDLDINVYGLKKVIIMAPKGDASFKGGGIGSGGEEGMIMEKILNILPMPGWESWIADGAYEEMDSIVNYNRNRKREAVGYDSRNNSFYDASTSSNKGGAGGGGGGGTLDDWGDDMGIEEGEDEQRKSEEKTTMKEEQEIIVDSEQSNVDNSSVAMNLASELAFSEMVLSEKQQQAAADEALDSFNVDDIPLPSYDDVAMTTQLLSTTKDNKRYSLTSLPEDEGEGTWTTTLTPINVLSPTLLKHGSDDDPSSKKETTSRSLSMDNQAEEEEDDDDEEGDDKGGRKSHQQQLQPSSQPSSQPSTGGRHRLGSGRLGEFSDDEDDEGTEGTGGDDNSSHTGDDEDDGEEHYHFGKSPVLVSSTVARSYQPASTVPTSFMRSKHNQSKYSWPIEAELDSNLDSASHKFEYLNIRDIKNIYSSNIFFILQGHRYTSVFTGNLSYGSTDSVYVLEHDKIFEWIRGAAASGWCWKWPMATQSFGRLRKRFFILRDNVLSYHKVKPLHEEDIASSFSHNTMHLTDTSTVSIGRKRLQKCLIITNPFDTLWLKMKKDFTNEAVKWVSEINKAISLFNKAKLILTKLRIESKWYHESPNFNLINIDVVTTSSSLDSELADSYCKVGLFCLRIPLHSRQYNSGGGTTIIGRDKRRGSATSSNVTDSPMKGSEHGNGGTIQNETQEEENDDTLDDVCTYSVDIATSDTQRLQLEVSK